MSAGDAPRLGRLTAFAGVFWAGVLVIVFAGGFLVTITEEDRIFGPGVVIATAWAVSSVLATVYAHPRIGALWPFAVGAVIVASVPLAYVAYIAGHLAAGGDLGFGND